MATYKQRKNRKKQSISRILIGTVCLLGLGSGALYTLERYNTPPLVGKWVSNETGEMVIFNEDGTVSVNELLDSPTYQKLTPNKMLYNIEGKQFEMYYNLDGRTLTWGMTEENAESFTRK